jgi:hypothetical protein
MEKNMLTFRIDPIQFTRGIKLMPEHQSKLGQNLEQRPTKSEQLSLIQLIAETA